MKNISINTWLIFIFVLDTGGWIGLRPFIMATFLLISIVNFNSKINIIPVVAWIVLILLMIPSIISGVNAGIEMTVVLPFIYPILIFPLFYFIAVNSKITSEQLINAGAFFSAFIIILFFGSQLAIPACVSLIDYLSNNPEAGFFKEKTTFFEIPVQGIYFKATLLLIPLGVLAAGAKRWNVLTLIIFALIVAQSKTGVFILSIFSMMTAIRREKISVISISIIIFFISALIIFAIVTESIYEDLALGFATRGLHAYSMYEVITNSWPNFFTGFGAGSSFYSYGFLDYTNDSEVSQLEVLRRYGILFLAALTAFFYITYKKLIKNYDRPWAISILSYFIVSASNPVLLSTPAILYYAVVASRISKKYKTNKIN